MQLQLPKMNLFNSFVTICIAIKCQLYLLHIHIRALSVEQTMRFMQRDYTFNVRPWRYNAQLVCPSDQRSNKKLNRCKYMNYITKFLTALLRAYSLFLNAFCWWPVYMVKLYNLQKVLTYALLWWSRSYGLCKTLWSRAKVHFVSMWSCFIVFFWERAGRARLYFDFALCGFARYIYMRREREILCPHCARGAWSLAITLVMWSYTRRPML